MKTWKPTREQQEHYDQEGYIVLRNLISRDEAMMMKGAILNHVLAPETGYATNDERDPMDPMNASPEGRIARFRKLNGYGPHSAVLWHKFYTSENILCVAGHFLGGDMVMKFSSVFMKPALTGAATPWHQDNGLWRDGETTPFNLWMAIDPSTKENGCLQFLAGSHRFPITPHVKYPDSVHAELPHETVSAALEHLELHHIELEPGSAVCWHSNLYHYSPPNTSAHSRIAIAAVYFSAETAAENVYHQRGFWVARGGEVIRDFPPDPFDGYRHPKAEAPPFPEATPAEKR